MVECGSLRRFTVSCIKEHLCPKCNHCSPALYGVLSQVRKFEPEDSEHHPPLQLRQRLAGEQPIMWAVCSSVRSVTRNCATSVLTMTVQRWYIPATTARIRLPPLSPRSTCCYCQSTYPVNALVPRDVVDYEITEEGIRMLTKTGTHVQQHVEHIR